MRRKSLSHTAPERTAANVLSRIAVLCIDLLLVSAPCFARQSDGIDRFLRLAPAPAYVECVLYRSIDHSWVIFAYNMGTGEWIDSRFGAGHARLADGTLYDTGLNPIDVPGFTVSDPNLSLERYYMPFVWLRQIADDPGHIESVAVDAETKNLIVEYAPEEGKHFRVNVDPTGRVTGFDALLPNGKTDHTVLAELGEAAPGYHLMQWTIRRPEYYYEIKSAMVLPIDKAPPVTRARVDALASDMRIRQSQERAEAARNAPPPDPAAPGPKLAPGSVVGLRQSAVQRWKYPFILAGAIVIALGVALWWRYRR